MGLQLVKELSSGHTAEYWRVSRIGLIKGGATDCFVELYKDQASAVAGKNPVEGKTYVWEGAEDPCTVAAMDAANPYALCYAKLKTLPEFSGAVDA